MRVLETAVSALSFCLQFRRRLHRPPYGIVAYIGKAATGVEMKTGGNGKVEAGHDDGEALLRLHGFEAGAKGAGVPAYRCQFRGNRHTWIWNS
jgi:hypothetical protein